jgi:formiminotetrahydrofolate cyclodeaminase
MSNYKISMIGNYIDIEIPKDKNIKEANDVINGILEKLQKAGITIGKLTDKDREAIRKIIKERGYKEIGTGGNK